jgi:hypothetical protein
MYVISATLSQTRHLVTFSGLKLCVWLMVCFRLGALGLFVSVYEDCSTCQCE